MRVRSLFYAVLFLFAWSYCFAQTFTITDLGTLAGGDLSGAHAINASGQITGFAGNTDGSDAVFRYSNGVMTSLGTLGGSVGTGTSINSSGQIAGYSTNSTTYRAFITHGDTLVDIGDLGGGSATAYAINDQGVVVGNSYLADDEIHPFLYSNGTMIDLGTLGSNQPGWWNSAQGINKSGAVVGISYAADGNFFGFVWRKGKMYKLGTLGGLWSDATAINDKGQITGQAYTKDGLAHAFITQGTRLIDLGTIDGGSSSLWGFGINNAGVVVGQSTFKDTYHAFVYANGKIRDLNKLIPTGSGWTLLSANGINDKNQIVGVGMHNGQEHAFLLTLR